MNRVIFIFLFGFILINYSDISSFNGSIENDQVAYSEFLLMYQILLSKRKDEYWILCGSSFI